jgi:transcriptional repressor NrdR
MRCPWCTAVDDKVVDSRAADDGASTRRRRECLACGRRFTTYERVEELPLVVIKRSGERQPFDRSKLVRGLEAALKNRPLGPEGVEAIAGDVEEGARMEGPEVTSEWLGALVLTKLRAADEVAYLRFASVHKGFEDAEDFEREMGRLQLREDES